jgi:hypothetical protein
MYNVSKYSNASFYPLTPHPVASYFFQFFECRNLALIRLVRFFVVNLRKAVRTGHSFAAVSSNNLPGAFTPVWVPAPQSQLVAD